MIPSMRSLFMPASFIVFNNSFKCIGLQHFIFGIRRAGLGAWTAGKAAGEESEAEAEVEEAAEVGAEATALLPVDLDAICKAPKSKWALVAAEKAACKIARKPTARPAFIVDKIGAGKQNGSPIVEMLA
mmetsp:Transcript_24787/g.43407  ORF Transcript_24787/g.43407 Transcript_24787/m.43407 type:complete len:129 (-) Transcript_24787:30-416(-)